MIQAAADAPSQIRVVPNRSTRLRASALVVLAVVAIASSASAQRHPDAPRNIARAKAALAPYAMLAGTWDGEARASVGRDQWMTVAQHERVEWHAFGTVLLIRGTGRSLDAANKDEVVFEALATIWYDAEQDKVRMRTHVDGTSIEPAVEVKADTIIWGFPVSGGRIRYTIAVNGDEWHEVGHFIREGAPPVLTVDMRLRRSGR